MGNKVEKITKKCSIMRMRIKMIGYRRSYDQFLYITLMPIINLSFNLPQWNIDSTHLIFCALIRKKGRK